MLNIVLCSAVLTVSAWWGCYGLSFCSSRLRIAQFRERADFAEKTLNTCFFALIVGLSFRAVARTYASPYLRWHGRSEAGRWAMCLCGSRLLWDTIHQSFTLPPKRRAQLLAHHCVASLGILVSLCCGNGEFFCCLAMASEITTVFLNNIRVARHFFPRHDATPRFVAINAKGLWCTYLMVRILLFPVCIMVMLSDCLCHSLVLRSVSHPVIVVCIALLSFLFGQSVIWFTEIHAMIWQPTASAVGEAARKPAPSVNLS